MQYLLIEFLPARLSSSAKYYLLAPKTESQHDRKGLVHPDKHNEIYLKIKVNPNVVITPLKVKHLRTSEKHEESKPSEDKSIVCRGPICIQKLLHSYAYEDASQHGNKYMRSEVPSKKRYSYTDSDTESDKEFEDLTRIKNPLTKSGEVFARELKRNALSTDYLDLSDLKRTLHKNSPRLYVTQGKPWDFENDEFTVTRNDKKGHSIFIGNKGGRRSNYYILRASDSEQSDSSEKSEESSEEVVEKKHKKHKRSKKKKTKKRKPKSDEGSSSQELSDESIPKRFEVIDNKKKKKIKLPYKIPDMYSEEKTIEISDEISAEFKPKKKHRRPSNGKLETYIQGGGRIISEPFDDSRRRLPHFLPKQYLWDPDDYHKLGYFWFNGPQGIDPGPWRINF